MTTAAGRAGMTVFAAVWSCVSVGESGGSGMPVMEPYAEVGIKVRDLKNCDKQDFNLQISQTTIQVPSHAQQGQSHSAALYLHP